MIKSFQIRALLIYRHGSHTGGHTVFDHHFGAVDRWFVRLLPDQDPFERKR